MIDRVAHCPPAHQLSADKLQIHIHPAVDAGYRGEIKVPLINLDPKHTAVFHPGDRIAQLVIQRYVEARFIPAETLPGSDRAERGFGSTGVAS